MRGVPLPIGDPGLVESDHLVEDPNRGIQQRQRQQRTGSLTEAQVEVGWKSGVGAGYELRAQKALRR
jgi:hypothetical protein